jgi:hypothetical protein
LDDLDVLARDGAILDTRSLAGWVPMRSRSLSVTNSLPSPAGGDGQAALLDLEDVGELEDGRGVGVVSTQLLLAGAGEDLFLVVDTGHRGGGL